MHFVQYVQYIFTRMEKKNKKAGRVGGNTPYITRVRVREKTLHTLHKVHKAPPGVDLLGGAKVHFCAVVQRLVAYRVSQVLHRLLESKHLRADKVHFGRALRRAGAGREEDIILHLFLRSRAVGQTPPPPRPRHLAGNVLQEFGFGNLPLVVFGAPP